MEEKGLSSASDTVSLRNFAQLTGLPEKVIIDELLLEDAVDHRGQMSLLSLREAMVKYLDRVTIDE